MSEQAIPLTPFEHVGWRCSRALCTWSDPTATGLSRSGPCPECGATEIVRIESDPVTETRRKARHCSVCGQPGHRFESCPVRPPGMVAPPKRPTTRGDRARATGNEPPPETRPRAGKTWAGHLEPVEGFEGLAIRRIDRLQDEVRARSRKPAYKPEDSTPLSEVLVDWRARYGLTAEESEVLFNRALDVLPSFRLVALAGVPTSEIHARGESVAKKTGERSITHAALVLVREALMFATFDREKRDAKREETEDEDDDG